MIKYVTIKKFEELTGYTEAAVNTKIRDGVWLEGKVFVKAPDGRNLISIEGYEQWVEMAAGLRKHQNRAMKSPSLTVAFDAAKGPSSSPTPLT